MGSSALEHAIKVRKPYTITKQRERWTEEEHSKFLEALKLYGRAWRQIEEHIGTKNAVQIRSHAQKFFSKVARESASHSSGAVKNIEIPPPRPKRKPVHPYPRKLGHSSSKIPVLEQSDWSSIPNLSISDQENRSPTSVLSAVGSDTFGSSASNLMNSCTSPASSAAESEPVGTLLSEHEDGCQSATTSPGDADKSLSPDRSIMEVDLGSDDCIPSKEASSMEAQATTLKLFGRTVLVTDTQKLFSSSCGNVEQCHWSVPTVNIESHHEDINMGQQIPVQTSEQNAAHEDLSSGEGTSQWNLWPGGMPPMFYCLPSHGNLSNPADASIVPLPWLWDFYGSVPLPLISPQSMSSEQDHLPSCRDSDDRGMHKEGSLTGSNIVYASEVGVWDSSSNAVNAGHSKDQDTTPALKLRQSETSAFRSLKASSYKPSRGFVPYRRCVAEKVVEHPQMAKDNGDNQEVQLCL